MMHVMLSMPASALGSSGNGFFSRKRTTLSDGAETSSVAAISTEPKESTLPQRCTEATQSRASTGVLSWNLSPSRSVMSHCLPSLLVVWPAAICGCGWYLLSTPYSVSNTMWAWLRVTSAVVHTGSSDARSDCGMNFSSFCPAAWPMRGAASAAVAARVDFRTSRRFMILPPQWRVCWSMPTCSAAAGSSPHQVAWCPPRQHGVNPVQRQESHGIACFHRGAAQVRQQHNVFQRRIAGIQLRLAFEHVEAGRGDMAGFQRRNQRGIVDQRAAGRICHHGAMRQLGNARSVQPVMRARAARGIQRQYLARSQETVV